MFAAVRYRRIKDIPGSKTVLIALAWGAVTSILPPISVFGTYRTTDAFIFVWVAALVFVRTAFFDILDMQGDRLVGKETIPTLLGEKRSLRLLKRLLAVLVVGLPGLAAFTPLSAFAATLALCPAAMHAILLGFEGEVLFSRAYAWNFWWKAIWCWRAYSGWGGIWLVSKLGKESGRYAYPLFEDGSRPDR